MRIQFFWVYLLKRLNARLAVSDARSVSAVTFSVQLLNGSLTKNNTIFKKLIKKEFHNKLFHTLDGYNLSEKFPG